MAVMRRFTYFFLFALALLLQACGEPAELKGSDGSDLRQVFTVVSDESKPPYKRTVEVTLKHKVSKEDLRLIAEEIKKRGRQNVERTFIGYRLEGQEPGTMYWATTHYNPELDVRILATD